MKKLKIGLDFDDVIAPFNRLAIELANRDYDFSPKLSINELTTWENTGRTSVIKKYYNSMELYDLQTKSVPKKNIDAVRELMEIADVYFISAVYPDWMSVRAKQIMTLFPEVSQNQIILGAAKDLVHFDFLLDDNINNVLTSPADYPVLFRKPWNQKMTGLLSVNSLDEFICLVKTILKMPLQSHDTTLPSVICLVGPTGSMKNEIANQMTEDKRFQKVTGYTTNPNDTSRVILSEEEFEKAGFFEKTRYAGYAYGIKKEEVEEMLNRGISPVIPIDICGAIGMKLHFPTVTVYCKRNKCELVRAIVSDATLTEEEKTLRILSLDSEKKNELICDYQIDSEEVANTLKSILN